MVDDEHVASGGNFTFNETKTFQVGSSSPTSCAGINTLSRQCGSAWIGAAAWCCPGLTCNGYKCVL